MQRKWRERWLGRRPHLWVFSLEMSLLFEVWDRLCVPHASNYASCFSGCSCGKRRKRRHSPLLWDFFFFFLGITVPKHFLMDVKQILLCNSIRSHPKKYSELEGNRMWFAFMVKDFVIFKFYMKCFVFVLKIGEGVCETSNAQKCFIFSPCQFFLTHTHIPLVKDSVMLFFPPSSSQVPSFCHVHPFLVFSMFSSIFCHYSQLEKFTKYLLILFPRVDLLILIVLGKNRVKP